MSIDKNAQVNESKRFSDERGFFVETYRTSQDGSLLDWKQDNWSRSHYRVLRGLHYQEGCAKLVRVIRGEIFDVAVDLKTGEWKSVILSDDNGLSFRIPAGFAHGFLVLSDIADVIYKVSKEYDAAAEGAVRWDSLGIGWPFTDDLIISERDRSAKPYVRGSY
jgi:dTDP-4-dehydrorhamnose 3,5-epimerase